MAWTKEYLDFVLVPAALILSIYHLFHIYRCLRFPETTVIGYENHFKKAWVVRMLQIEAKDIGVDNQRHDIGINFPSNDIASIEFAYRNMARRFIVSSKTLQKEYYLWQYKLIDQFGQVHNDSHLLPRGFRLFCSMFSTLHASFLISMPNADIPVSYVQKAVIRGGACWSIGLRAIYYATVLLLWIFGPITMFVGSLIMVMFLHLLDRI